MSAYIWRGSDGEWKARKSPWRADVFINIGYGDLYDPLHSKIQRYNVCQLAGFTVSKLTFVRSRTCAVTLVAEHTLSTGAALWRCLFWQHSLDACEDAHRSSTMRSESGRLDEVAYLIMQRSTFGSSIEEILVECCSLEFVFQRFHFIALWVTDVADSGTFSAWTTIPLCL